MLSGPSAAGVATRTAQRGQLGSAIISAEQNNLASRDPLAGMDSPTMSSSATSGAHSPHAHMPRDGFMQIVWRQRVVVAACMAIGLVLSGVYLTLATKVYRGEASLYVAPANGGNIFANKENGGGGANAAAINPVPRSRTHYLDPDPGSYACRPEHAGSQDV